MTCTVVFVWQDNITENEDPQNRVSDNKIYYAAVSSEDVTSKSGLNDDAVCKKNQLKCLLSLNSLLV